MRTLLDTHALLWFRQGNTALSETAKLVIEDSTNELFISIASLWEMAIKVNLGKLDLGLPYRRYVERCLRGSEISLLPVTADHLGVLCDLPLCHRDPFDRLMAAQCLAEDLEIISADAVFEEYDVPRIW